ncbi:MAG: M4 family metallopeptidase [Myxococcaceae bacterium]|nr:M4 family metallopeptidase [Myxococcaceae bacterium]
MAQRLLTSAAMNVRSSSIVVCLLAAACELRPTDSAQVDEFGSEWSSLGMPSGALLPLEPRLRTQGVPRVDATPLKGSRIDKYTFTMKGLPVHGLGMRVRVYDDGTRAAIDTFELSAAAAAASSSPKLSSQTCALRALDARRGKAPSVVATSAPALAFEAQLAGRTIEALRLTWRVPVRDVPGVGADLIGIVDATSGEVVGFEVTAAAETATGNGFFNSNVTLQVATTDGGQCLTDLTRGQNVANPAPCGDAAGPGLHTYVMIPSAIPGAFVSRRVIDADGAFGDGLLPLVAQDYAGERGRTVASDATYGLTRAYDYFKVNYGRQKLGLTNSLELRVNDQAWPANAAFASNGVAYVGPRGGTALYPLANIEVLSHEYTHGVLFDEVGTALDNTEYQGIHEGIADVFAVLADAWARNPLVPVGMTPPTSWEVLDGLFAGGLPRYFDQPSRDGVGIDAWTPWLAVNIAFGLDEHAVGGINRRQFYFMTHGVVPSGPGAPPTTAFNTSAYLPGGMNGIGLYGAAWTTYETIVDGLMPGSRPTFAQLREAMISTAESRYGRCSSNHKAVIDSWAAVGVGAVADRVGPRVTTELVRTLDVVNVRARVFEPPQKQLAGPGPVRFELDGQFYVDVTPIWVELPQLLQAYCGEPTPCWVALADLQVPSAGLHTLDVIAGDGCDNTTRVTQAIEVDPPTGLAVVDQNTWRSSLRRFRIDAQDQQGPLTYRLSLGTLVRSGTMTLNGPTVVDFELGSAVHGATTLKLVVSDPIGNSATLIAPYFVDRQPPRGCSADIRDSLDRTGFDVWGSGAERETNDTDIEIIDVWVNGAPFWWVDRGYPSSSERGMSTICCSNSKAKKFTLPHRHTGPDGVYNVETKCFDTWGNLTADTERFVKTDPPTITATVTYEPEQSQFTIGVMAESPLANINDIEYDEFPSTNVSIIERDECGNTNRVCNASFTGTLSPGQTRTLTVNAEDESFRENEIQVVVTMPQPPPPPPPPSTFAESEDNDRPQTADLPGASIRTITGNVRYDDFDGLCTRTVEEHWASCSLDQPWNCRHACGDYFGFDLGPGQSLIARINVDNTSSCFRRTMTMLLAPNETSYPLQTTELPDLRTRLTNLGSTTRRVFVGVMRHISGATCAPTFNTNYTIEIERQ